MLPGRSAWPGGRQDSSRTPSPTALLPTADPLPGSWALPGLYRAAQSPLQSPQGRRRSQQGYASLSMAPDLSRPCCWT